MCASACRLSLADCRRGSGGRAQSSLASKRLSIPYSTDASSSARGMIRVWWSMPGMLKRRAIVAFRGVE